MADDLDTDGCTTEELHALHPDEADLLPGLSEVEPIEPYVWATEVDIVAPYDSGTEVDTP